MPYAYTEDQLVEQPAIGLLTELGVVQTKTFLRTRDLLLPRLLSLQVKLETEAV